MRHQSKPTQVVVLPAPLSPPALLVSWISLGSLRRPCLDALGTPQLLLPQDQPLAPRLAVANRPLNGDRTLWHGHCLHPRVDQRLLQRWKREEGTKRHQDATGQPQQEDTRNRDTTPRDMRESE